MGTEVGHLSLFAGAAVSVNPSTSSELADISAVGMVLYGSRAWGWMRRAGKVRLHPFLAQQPTPAQSSVLGDLGAMRGTG